MDIIVIFYTIFNLKSILQLHILNVQLSKPFILTIVAHILWLSIVFV